MLGMRVGSRAILHSAEGPSIESPAILLLRGRIVGDAAITESLGWLTRRVPRSFRNRAWRDILAHVAAVLIPQSGIRIRNARAMFRIVGPCAGPMRVANISGVEIVLVNERIVHNHGAIAPAGMPTPSTPSAPAASEEQTDVDAASETEI